MDWLLDVWEPDTQPGAGGRTPHFSGRHDLWACGGFKVGGNGSYPGTGAILSKQGVVLRKPVSKQDLIAEFGKARLMMYKGDDNETFCLALGEAQAAGVPAVVQRYGSVVEQ